MRLSRFEGLNYRVKVRFLNGSKIVDRVFSIASSRKIRIALKRPSSFLHSTIKRLELRRKPKFISHCILNSKNGDSSRIITISDVYV